MSPYEYVNFLANSSTRHQILQELAEQPIDPGPLASRCSCTRPTIHRTLTTLQAYDWVNQVEEGYVITPVGKQILHQYDALLETFSTVMEYPQFFNHLGEEGMDIPLDAVDVSTVVTATPRNPHAPLTYFTTAIQEISSEQCLVIAPIISPEFIEASQPLLEAGTTLELIYDKAGFETVRTEFKDELMTAFEMEQITLYLCPRALPFALVLLDEQVFVHAYEPSGQLSACLDSTDPALYVWAKDKYAEYREAARHIADPSELP